MKIFITLIAFVVLLEEIEPRPTIGTRYSYVKSPSRYYDSDSDSDSDYDSDSSSDDSDSDSDDSDSDSDDDYNVYNCPNVSRITGNTINVNISCENGILFVNGLEVKNAKQTDNIEIVSDRLIKNGKFIRRIQGQKGGSISFHGSNNRPSNRIGNKGCPGVTMIGNVDVFHKCVNGKLYVNNQVVNGVKPTDNVRIISNNLKVNGKFIRYVPPFGKNSSFRYNKIDDHDDDNNDSLGWRRLPMPPGVTKQYCVGVYPYMKNGKFMINNNFELKNYKLTDKVLIHRNNLYVNGKFIRYIKPYNE